MRCAFDGQMALEAIDRRRTDLVIADVMMPRFNGSELAQRLRRRPRPTRVILIGAGRLDRETSGVPFLQKPFDLDQLVAISRRLLPPRWLWEDQARFPVGAPVLVGPVLGDPVTAEPRQR